MDPIKPPQSLMELTAERIREAIIRGELPLGSKVSEQKLADTLRISRSPVREALALLQIEGLIRVLPKRGSFVFTPDEKTVDDLCDPGRVRDVPGGRFHPDAGPCLRQRRLHHVEEHQVIDGGTGAVAAGELARIGTAASGALKAGWLSKVSVSSDHAFSTRRTSTMPPLPL